MTISAYPLAWPAGFPRTKIREKGQFRTSFDAARQNVVRSLKAFAADSRKQITDPVLSTNVDLMDRLKDNDPGVAVWFTWDGLQVCIPVDRYLTAAANLQAIHHIIEARRVELRHGTLALVRASFTGFTALPPPRSHWDVLGIPPGSSRDKITDAYREKARLAHPDAGGSTAAMTELNQARDAALREIGT
jgi:hypothetical protein